MGIKKPFEDLIAIVMENDTERILQDELEELKKKLFGCQIIRYGKILDTFCKTTVEFKLISYEDRLYTALYLTKDRVLIYRGKDRYDRNKQVGK
jgi:hypothetical protein